MMYMLVTGGVVSGLGKAVTASSTGVVLKALGLRFASNKIDVCNEGAWTVWPLPKDTDIDVFVQDLSAKFKAKGLDLCTSKESDLFPSDDVVGVVVEKTSRDADTKGDGV